MCDVSVLVLSLLCDATATMMRQQNKQFLAHIFVVHTQHYSKTTLTTLVVRLETITYVVMITFCVAFVTDVSRLPIRKAWCP
jgi:hypothetical protein